MKTKTMSILIIEDDKKLAELLKFGLASKGHSASYITNGEQGRQEVEANPEKYNLIILDIMLPGQNGFEIIKNLRDKGIDTPILTVSALNSSNDKDLALKFGANDYLSKPFIFRELLSKIRRVSKKTKKQKVDA